MGARILVIEDNEPNLELMTYLLRAFGHDIESARDGEAGVALACGGGFDLLICDIQLPKRDGFEVVAEVRRRLGRATPIVAVTAFAQVGDREKVLSAGFDGYISKPIVPETFVAQVEVFLPVPERSVDRALTPAPATPATAPLAPRRSATIMVVDGVEANVQPMRSLLEPFGYRVVAATGVREALRQLGETVPDLIVSDLHLHDGSGLDLVARVKGTPALAGIPFIFLSSTAREAAERSDGLSMGARKFIVRPIDAPALLTEIEECLVQP